jgi:hypothetical protein
LFDSIEQKVSSCFEVYEGFPAMILLDIVVLCGTRDLLAGHELDVDPPRWRIPGPLGTTRRSNDGLWQ